MCPADQCRSVRGEERPDEVNSDIADLRKIMGEQIKLEVGSAVTSAFQPVQNEVSQLAAKVQEMELKMNKMQDDVKSTAASSAVSASQMKSYVAKSVSSGPFVSKYFVIKGWIDYTSKETQIASRWCYNDVRGLLEQLKTSSGEYVTFLDCEGAQASIENSCSFTDLRIYYQTPENITRREALPGLRVAPTFKDKSDMIKRLRDNFMAFKGKNMRFAPHVGEEAQAKRTAAGKMYSLLRSYNVTDTRIKVEYKRTVDFFLLNELDRGATPKLFASFINETSGWTLYGNVL